MVLLELKTVAGGFAPAEVRRLMAALTDAVVAQGGEALRPHVAVLVTEVERHRWSAGGLPPGCRGHAGAPRAGPGGDLSGPAEHDQDRRRPACPTR